MAVMDFYQSQASRVMRFQEQLCFHLKNKDFRPSVYTGKFENTTGRKRAQSMVLAGDITLWSHLPVKMLCTTVLKTKTLLEAQIHS